MVETVGPWSPRGAQAGVYAHVRQPRKGRCGQGSPSRKSRCGRGFVRVLGAPASALSPCSAIWLTDVAQSQTFVFLGNEQGRERAEGLLQWP